MQSLYIGIMSGTSADGIDAVVISGSPKLSLLGHHSIAISDELRARIHGLCASGPDEIERLGRLDRELADAFADCINALLHKTQLSPESITAIGSHGQTIRHRPPAADLQGQAFTLQIVDPNTLVERTGITVVADFRRRDVAAGGQGAPLVPAFHQAVFGHPTRTRAIVNIGGMANITWLRPGADTLGFDTGPGNALLNDWIHLIRGEAYDRDGQWALSGKVNDPLLNQLLSHPFLTQPWPKSTGREAFNLPWLQQQLAQVPELPSEDIQATLVAFTAKTIGQEITRLQQQAGDTNPIDIAICGGGARNPAIMAALAGYRPEDQVMTTETLGIAPEWIEAIAFAWLAEQTLNHKPGNLRAVTGAARDVILGGVYFAN